MSHDTTAESFLPLNPRVLSLLVVLLGGAAHGYAIKQAVEEASEGRVTLDPGSLYRMISKLVDDGLIRETDGGGIPDDDTRRRYYAPTDLGRDVVAAETRRLAGLLAQARPLLPGAGA